MNPPGGFPADAGEAPKPKHQFNDHTPGKFHTLSQFLKDEDQYQDQQMPGELANIEPGDIIYINDTDCGNCLNRCGSRINHRIMLVLYLNYPSSYTCLCFCRQPDFSDKKTLHDFHASVSVRATERTPQQSGQVHQADPSFLNLEILKPTRHSSPLVLNGQIYLNLQEHWTVQKSQPVQVTFLGKAEDNSFKELKPEILRIFSKALGAPAPEKEEPQGEPVVQRANSSRKPERGYHVKKRRW